jgi:hypothetical protein
VAKLIYSTLISLDVYREDEYGQIGWGVAAGGQQHDHSVNSMSLQHSRGDKTAIELFRAGIQGWETGLRLRIGLQIQ